MIFDDDLTACAQLVERGDPDRFAATMAAPVGARAVLFPIYAFNIEISRAPWVTKEPMIAEMRLQWWTDALEEIASGGVVRRHEVVTSLAHVLDAEAAHQLQRAVEARRWDAYRAPFEDEAGFTAYIEDTSAALLLAAAQALEGAMPEALRDLGYASGLAQFLRAVPELERQGRIPLIDGRLDALRALAQGGLDRLDAARRARGDIPRGARAVALAAWQAGPILQQVAAAPEKVANGTLGQSDARKKARLIWQAATGRW
ncbi:squalene/phytoene synthase family protein [Marivita sp. GX14005]|uniref:squalene/phytoene synthase family protein n=1 Tax=Marivita sp. GX14005 TaxID=2942276 RepID=UPI00201A0E8C|nr:squalene/phytoene synthase family protein [Marivita sp. GX14005]MCL3883618.1 squalene/phytoene synthase family protein [Marivita sp. GX14005]